MDKTSTFLDMVKGQINNVKTRLPHSLTWWWAARPHIPPHLTRIVLYTLCHTFICLNKQGVIGNLSLGSFWLTAPFDAFQNVLQHFHGCGLRERIRQPGWWGFGMTPNQLTWTTALHQGLVTWTGPMILPASHSLARYATTTPSFSVANSMFLVANFRGTFPQFKPTLKPSHIPQRR